MCVCVCDKLGSSGSSIQDADRCRFAEKPGGRGDTTIYGYVAFIQHTTYKWLMP